MIDWKIGLPSSVSIWWWCLKPAYSVNDGDIGNNFLLFMYNIYIPITCVCSVVCVLNFGLTIYRPQMKAH